MPIPVNKFLPLARLAVFGAASFLSLIILGLSAHITSWTGKWYSVYFDFAALALAISLLSLITLPAMIGIGRSRAGAIPSFIAVELAWTGFLWILWLATAGTTAGTNFTGGRCGILSGSGWSMICAETNAIEAFAFLNWLMLLGYFMSLLLCSVMAFQRGNTRIWTSTVDGTDFESSIAAHTHEKYAVENAGYAPNAGFSPQYPPSNMVVGTPSPQHIQPSPGVAQV